MRTSRFLALLAALALAGAFHAGRADAADPPGTAADTQQRIDKLERELRELKTDTRKIEVSNEEAAKLKPVAGWDKGFFLQSPDGQNKINVGGYVRFDGRYFTNSVDGGTSTFLFRRARLDLKGKFLKYYEFKFMPDFAGGQVVIQDAYLNVNYVPWARLQAGKYKSPTGLERLQSANALTFIERGLPTNLVPNRDLGFMLWGQPFYGALEYQLAIMDGTVDGGSLNNDTDVNDDKMFAGRLFFLPFKDRPWEFARGFGFGIAGTYGEQKGSLASPQLPQYRSDGQQVFFSYVTNTPATAAGTAKAYGGQSRIAPQGYWYWGPFGFLWEWTQSAHTVQLHSVPAPLTATSWQTQISYVLTGEESTFRGVTPNKNFDPFKLLDGYWGAWQIAARYAELSVEKKVYTLGFASRARSAREADAWAIGVNWVLNPMVRLMLDFDNTTYTGGAANGANRKEEELLMSRVQFVF